MKGYLLDTSALVTHFKNEPGAGKVQSIFADDDAEVYISALSISELARCLLHLGAERDEARDVALEYAGMATQVVQIDAAVSIRAYELGSICETRLPLVDALIAACAVCSETVLIHKDAHFNTIPSELMSMEILTGN